PPARAAQARQEVTRPVRFERSQFPDVGPAESEGRRAEGVAGGHPMHGLRSGPQCPGVGRRRPEAGPRPGWVMSRTCILVGVACWSILGGLCYVSLPTDALESARRHVPVGADEAEVLAALGRL